jgi:DNA-binding PadR family transcriptional regulator
MYVDLLILSHLLSKPSYGYEIKKSVGRIVGGAVINNNVLYPTLRKFEGMGAVTKTVKAQEGKPDKHLYRATKLGKEIFGELLREFPPEVAKDEIEFVVRVSFFHLLEPRECLQMLQTRKQILGDLHAHLERVCEEAEASGYPYASKVVNFQKRKVEHELEWLAELARDLKSKKR